MVFPQDLPVRPGIIPARAGFTLGDLGDDLLNRDHPRSRGVYKLTLAISPYMRGSSPLARGLQTTQSPPLSRAGIIPARAGFTTGRPGRGPPRRDHPRSRGVYAHLNSHCCSPSGSSPLARGLPLAVQTLALVSGIIPARAGFTPRSTGWHTPGPDHPRSRGVYQAWKAPAEPVSGSSPLARGLLSTGDALISVGRIIPARAGFTGGRGSGRCRVRDHPRSRGVYRPGSCTPLLASGSSPLARGLHMSAREKRDLLGIIPARAGFTSDRRRRRRGPRDHPRSRGVYCPMRCFWRRRSGSSPLARGLRGGAHLRGPPARIIPARAGFTSASSPARPRPRDHPRSRGVYGWPQMPHPRPAGSSPLARGLRRQAAPPRDSIGIIPARAGFTGCSRSVRARLSDHPRSRGVYAAGWSTRPGLWGSSPLARGLPGVRPGRG